MKDIDKMTLEGLKDELAQFRVELVRRDCTQRDLQSKIDRLMWEYCPQEMTPEQIGEFEKSVKVVPDVRVSGVPYKIPRDSIERKD